MIAPLSGLSEFPTMTSSDLKLEVGRLADYGSDHSVLGDSPDDMVIPEIVDVLAVDGHLQATLVFPPACDDYDASWPKIQLIAGLVRKCIQQKDPLGRIVAVKVSRSAFPLSV